MDKPKSALDALIQSRDHWIQNYHAGVAEADIGGTACALCEYVSVPRMLVPDCVHCVIGKTTGLTSCRGTPWRDAYLAQIQYFNNGTVDRVTAAESFKKHALRMLMYLQALLDKELAAQRAAVLAQ